MIVIVNNSHDDDPSEKTPLKPLTDALASLEIEYKVVKNTSELVIIPKRLVYGIILTGTTVYTPNAQSLIAFNVAAILRFPEARVLGICWGYQLLCQIHCGIVSQLHTRNEGMEKTNLSIHHPLFYDMHRFTTCSYSHNNFVEKLPPHWARIATLHIEGIDIAVGGASNCGKYYGTMFHPEYKNIQVFENFWNICRRSYWWRLYRSMPLYSIHDYVFGWIRWCKGA